MSVEHPRVLLFRKDDGGASASAPSSTPSGGSGPDQTGVHVDSVRFAVHPFTPGPSGKCTTCGKSAHLMTKGEAAGHAFRGNQYVAGEGGGPISEDKLLPRLLKRPNGFTVDPVTGRDVKSGYAVAGATKNSKIVPADQFRKNGKSLLHDYLGRARTAAAKDGTTKVGGWFDKVHNEFVLDFTTVVHNRQDAIQIGAINNQQAIYHLDTGTTIPVGGTGGRTTAGAGAAVTKQFLPIGFPERHSVPRGDRFTRSDPAGGHRPQHDGRRVGGVGSEDVRGSVWARGFDIPAGPSARSGSRSRESDTPGHPATAQGLIPLFVKGDVPGHAFHGNQYQAVGAAIKNALTDELRHPKYRGDPNPMAGHCYVASEAMYHMMGGKDAGLKPMFIKHEGEPHWFLRHYSGRNIDLTASQFKTPVPYDQAKGKGFLTREPSARAKVVMERARASMVRKDGPPDEARDFHGRWTDGSTGAPSSSPGVITGRGVTEFPPEFLAREAKKAASLGLTEKGILAQYEKNFAAGDVKNAQWYHQLNNDVMGIVDKTGASPEQVAGVISSIAALREWGKNLRDAQTIISTVRDNKPFDVSQEQADEWNGRRDPSRIVLQPGTYEPRTADPLVTTLYDPKLDGVMGVTGSKPIVNAILLASDRAHPADIIGGPKLRNFYNNILAPNDGRFSTIDTWMYRAGVDPNQQFDTTVNGKKALYTLAQYETPYTNAAGKQQEKGPQHLFQSSPGKIVSGGKITFPAGVGLYNMFQRALAQGAAMHNMLPNEYQAVVWQTMVDQAGGKAYVQ